MKEISLQDALKFVVDNRGKTAPTEDNGIPLIATNCVNNNSLYPQKINVRYVSEETYKNWFRSHPEPGDILLTNKGSQNGAVCLVPDTVDFCIAQDMVGLRADETKIDPLYLFAALRSSIVQKRIKSLNVDAVIPHFKKTDFDKLMIPLPSRGEQELIGKLHFDFSRKIDLNYQTNQTLEQIAQAIFKSWFVDFEPTRAKIAAKQRWLAQHDSVETSSPTCYAEQFNNSEKSISLEDAMTRAAMAAISGKSEQELDQLSPGQLQQLKETANLFPDEFVDSELGDIPEGWMVRKFGDVSMCFDSKRIPLSKKQRETKKPGTIPYYGATSIMDYINEWIFDDIYLLLGEDGSVIKEDGTPFVQYIWGRTWVNNHAHVLKGCNGVSTEQLMLFINRKNINAYVTGAVQLKLNQGNMNRIPFIDAGERLNNCFHEIINPLFVKYRSTVEENMSLTEMRDSLLPKLLSGEIDLTQVA